MTKQYNSQDDILNESSEILGEIIKDIVREQQRKGAYGLSRELMSDETCCTLRISHGMDKDVFS